MASKTTKVKEPTKEELLRSFAPDGDADFGKFREVKIQIANGLITADDLLKNAGTLRLPKDGNDFVRMFFLVMASFAVNDKGEYLSAYTDNHAVDLRRGTRKVGWCIINSEMNILEGSVFSKLKNPRDICAHFEQVTRWLIQWHVSDKEKTPEKISWQASGRRFADIYGECFAMDMANSITDMRFNRTQWLSDVGFAPELDMGYILREHQVPDVLAHNSAMEYKDYENLAGQWIETLTFDEFKERLGKKADFKDEIMFTVVKCTMEEFEWVARQGESKLRDCKLVRFWVDGVYAMSYVNTMPMFNGVYIYDDWRIWSDWYCPTAYGFDDEFVKGLRNIHVSGTHSLVQVSSIMDYGSIQKRICRKDASTVYAGITQYLADKLDDKTQRAVDVAFFPYLAFMSRFFNFHQYLSAKSTSSTYRAQRLLMNLMFCARAIPEVACYVVRPVAELEGIEECKDAVVDAVNKLKEIQDVLINRKGTAKDTKSLEEFGEKLLLISDPEVFNKAAVKKDNNNRFVIDNLFNKYPDWLDRLTDHRDRIGSNLDFPSSGGSEMREATAIHLYNDSFVRPAILFASWFHSNAAMSIAEIEKIQIQCYEALTELDRKAAISIVKDAFASAGLDKIPKASTKLASVLETSKARMDSGMRSIAKKGVLISSGPTNLILSDMDLKYSDPNSYLKQVEIAMLTAMLNNSAVSTASVPAGSASQADILNDSILKCANYLIGGRQGKNHLIYASNNSAQLSFSAEKRTLDNMPNGFGYVAQFLTWLKETEKNEAQRVLRGEAHAEWMRQMAERESQA